MGVKTLADIPVNSIDRLQWLAGFAPKDEPKKPAPTKRLQEKSPGNANERVDLGAVDVERYLNQFNIENKAKTDGSKTMYLLDRCLFDPSHTKNEAAVVQDDSGLITYQCFHNSCQGQTWKDARQLISGDASLAEFCANYDPDWKPKEKKTTRDEKRSWLSFNEKGRAIINTSRLAGYLEAEFEPIFWEDITDQFYNYQETGVWTELAEAGIRQVTRRELADLAKAHNIKEALQLLKDETYISQRYLYADPFILNLKNGMLDVRTLEMHPHAPKYYSRVQMPVSYDPDKDCPLWIETLAQIFADDLVKIDVLQQFFGYCLYPTILFPCAVFQIGGGGNGKGVVEHVLGNMLGHENVSHISMQRMQKDFGPVEIKDKLLNSCGETEAGALDVTNFKKIAAGDKIQAEVKYKSDVKFTPIAKHLISMNSFPGLREKTKSFFRRVIVLEYQQVFEGDAQDVHLGDKLLDELDGIFNWALDGLKYVVEAEEITVPSSVEEAKERFREATNPVILFVKEACALGDEYSVAPPDLYGAYKNWCDESGIRKNRMLGKKNFYEQIRLNFRIHRKERQDTRDVFAGIGLVVEDWRQCTTENIPA